MNACENSFTNLWLAATDPVVRRQLLHYSILLDLANSEREKRRLLFDPEFPPVYRVGLRRWRQLV